MSDKKKKAITTLKSLLPYIIGAATGAAIGAVVCIFLFGGDGSSTSTSSKTYIVLALLMGLASFYVSLLLHIILHEAGHLVCGLVSGYKFVSFSVGSLTLIKEKGKLRVKRYGIVGVGGQCLMSPPEPAGSFYPYKLYYLGGSLANFLASAVFLLLFMLLKDTYFYAWVIFLPAVSFDISIELELY